MVNIRKQLIFIIIWDILYGLIFFDGVDTQEATTSFNKSVGRNLESFRSCDTGAK